MNNSRNKHQFGIIEHNKGSAPKIQFLKKNSDFDIDDEKPSISVKRVRRSTLCKFFSKRKNVSKSSRSRSSRINDEAYTLSKLTNISSSDLQTSESQIHKTPKLARKHKGIVKDWEKIMKMK